MIVRFGEHGGATDSDRQSVDSLALDAVIDLRSEEERLASPNRLPGSFSGKTYFSRSYLRGEAPHVAGETSPLTSAEVRDRYYRLYRNFPFRPPLIEAFRQFFKALAHADGATLVHCVAGKDRTGVAVALIQRFLGVASEDVVADYLLTSTLGNVQARLRAHTNLVLSQNPLLEAEAIQTLLDVEPEYVLEFFSSIEQRCGTVEDYVTDVLGISAAMQVTLKAKLIVN